MSRRLGSVVSLGAAAVAVLIVGSVARAQQVKSTISIRYIACCINPPPPGSRCCYCSDNCTSMMLGRDQPAGVDAINWNDVQGEVGVFSGLVRDIGGVRIATEASVQWQARTASSNPAGSIFFVGAGDTLLMTDYLDQDTDQTDQSVPTFVQIVNIPIDMAVVGYDVYIYTLTIVPNLGGTYEVNGLGATFVLPGGNGVAFGPDFVEANSLNPIGNYVVFRGLSGTAVTITAINAPGGGKAPINGIQIVSRID